MDEPLLDDIAASLSAFDRLTKNASGRTRTCTSVHLKHAPLPIGLPKRRFSNQWIPEGVEPSSPGCRPGIFPLDDGPELSQALREGFEPSPAAFGGPCSIRLSYRNDFLPRSGPGRIRTCNSSLLRRAPLPSWATEPSAPLSFQLAARAQHRGFPHELKPSRPAPTASRSSRRSRRYSSSCLK